MYKLLKSKTTYDFAIMKNVYQKVEISQRIYADDE